MFEPKFNYTANVHECAVQINLPHEDFPDRVSATEEVINDFISAFEEGRIDAIRLDHCRYIHSVIMADCWHAGSYKSLPNMVNGQGTALPALVPSLLHDIFPVTTTTELEIWYKEFEEIHAFVDGNGRVGASIIAIISYVRSNGKQILCPCQ